MPGDRAVDLGAGVGAAGLALAMRVPDVDVTLVEIDPELAAHRRGEYRAQRTGRAGARGDARRHGAVRMRSPPPGSAPGSADHVLMNPPFNDPARQNVSPDPARRAAHAAADGALAAWIDAAAWLLHSAGTLTMIWRADGLAEVLAALERALRRYRGAAGAWPRRPAGDPRPGAREQGQPRAARAAAGA